MLHRYVEEMKRMEHIAFSLSGAQVTLTTPLDSFGEFLSEGFVEHIKDVTSEVVSAIRKQDLNPTKIEDLWKL